MKHRIVTVNDAGYPIGEDTSRCRYLDSEVDAVREMRKAGMPWVTISEKMEIPIRTVRDYCSGRIRNQSVAGWKRVPIRDEEKKKAVNKGTA